MNRFLLLIFFAIPAAHGDVAGIVEPSRAAPTVPTGAPDQTLLPGVAVVREAQTLHLLYAAQAGRLLWSERGQLTHQATGLVDILRSAGSYGLDPSDYSADLIATEASRLSTNSYSQEWSRFDVLLSRAAIRLVTHLHFGRIDPRAAGFELNESRDDLDVVAAVASLAVAKQVTDAVSAVEPHFYHYALLKVALARYRNIAADPLLTRLPEVGRRTLRAADTYAGAPALRKLLTAVGDLPATDARTTADDQTLDPALVQALQRFQDRHGITPNGSLDTQTFIALTTPIAKRVRQIELTLERWRWLPPFKSPPIIVNIPQFRLFAFHTIEDRVADITQMPVIVGQTYPRTQTPIFVGDMKYVVFRPYWDVPRSITLREMLPKIRAGSDYLERNNLEIVRGQSDGATVMSPTSETVEALAAGQLRLRQRPGDDNALGLIKFIFPNAHNVYLHSTPAHQLFLQSRRAFSHGCIRVSDPTALAVFVLRNAAGNWDDARIVAAMHAGANSSRVELLTPIRVMILYGTAQATEAGPIQFFDDIYGHDHKLEELLSRRLADARSSP